MSDKGLPPSLVPPAFSADELQALSDRAAIWAHHESLLRTHSNSAQRATTYAELAQAAHHLRAMLLMDAYWKMTEAMFGPPQNPPEKGDEWKEPRA